MITNMYTKEQKEKFLMKRGYSKTIVDVWSVDRFDEVVDEGTREIYFHIIKPQDKLYITEVSQYELDNVFKYEFAQSILDIL